VISRYLSVLLSVVVDEMLKTAGYEQTLSGDALRTLLRSVKPRSVKQTSNDDAVLLQTDNVDSEHASDFRYTL